MTSENNLKKSILYTRRGDKGLSQLYNGEKRPKASQIFHALGDLDETNSLIGLAIQYCKSNHKILNTPLFEISASCKISANHGSAWEEEDGSSQISSHSRVHQDEEYLYTRSDLSLITMLEEIQCCLLDIGSHIATPATHSTNEEKKIGTRFDPSRKLLKELEIWTDYVDSLNPPLRSFVLPGGNLAAAQLHLARSVCRRAERNIVSLAIDQDQCEGETNARDGNYENDSNLGLGEYGEHYQVRCYMNRLSDFLFASARWACVVSGDGEIAYKRSEHSVEGSEESELVFQRRRRCPV